MLRGAGLMLGGGFKSFGGFMLALGSSTVSWAGIGVPGMAAGIFVAGAGASDMSQGAEEFFLGMSGDSTTPTRNGMSDLFYGGNDTIYHLSTGTAAMAGSMLTPYVNTQAAKMAAGKPAVTEPVVTEPVVAEAAGGTADDALEQAIVETEGVEGGTYASSNKINNLLSGRPELTGSTRDKLLATVQDSELIKIVNELYRPGATVGDGGTAAILAEEFSGGSSAHLLKAAERLKQLNKLANSGRLGINDLDIVEALIDDLESAISLYN